MPPSPAARAAAMVFAAAAPLYAATACRTVGFVDRGELAAVAWTFGIAHPTGYPTLTLLAGAWARLVPLRPILALNLLAALLAAAGAAILALLLDRVLAAAWPECGPRLRAALAALAAATAGLTLTWWQQANGFEVYALHALLMPLVALLGLRWLDALAPPRPDRAPATEPDVRRRARRAGAAFALATGLALTNHLTTLLLAPGLLAAALARLGPRGLARAVPPLVAPFLLGLLPYAWLPLRSAAGPRFDWGATDTLRGFLRHVTGADYRAWMFDDPAAMALQLRYVLWRVPWDWAWIGLPIAAVGAAALLRRAPAAGLAALLFVAAGAAFAIGYRIPDLDAYLLTTTLGLAILTAAGLARLAERFGGRAALGAAALLAVAGGALHARECDESGNRLAEAFARDWIGPLPAHAVLISDLWEIGVAPACYLQEVEGFRRDVTLVSPRLARAGWYLDELARRAPALVAGAGPAFADYRAALGAAEAGRAIGAGGREATRARLEALRRRCVDALAAGAMRDRRPVFAGDRLPEAREAWRRVPYHRALWLRADSAYVAEPEAPLHFRPWTGRLDAYAAQAFWTYGESRVARARYEDAHGRPERAAALMREAAAFDPGIRPERVAPLPLGADAMVLRCARFFRAVAQEVAAAR